MEGLENSEWTIKSDVWSFGIVLSELCGMGDPPYINIDNAQDLIDYLVRFPSYRLWATQWAVGVARAVQPGQT